jgi:AcrR family transcriptional regulator
MATQEQRRESTRRGLVEAARKLFDRKGFEGASVDEIVRTADVAKGTFYQHFESKADIALAVARMEHSEKAPLVLEALEKGEDAFEILQEIFSAMCRRFEENPGLAENLVWHAMRAGESAVPGPRDPRTSTRGLVEAVVKRGQAQGILRKDVKAHEIAEIAMGVVLQAVFAWSRGGRAQKLRPLVMRSLGILMEGVALGRLSR